MMVCLRGELSPSAEIYLLGLPTSYVALGESSEFWGVDKIRVEVSLKNG